MDVGRPPLISPIGGLQFTLTGVAQYAQPDRFRLGKGEADTAILEDAGVARHRVRATNHTMLHTVRTRERRQVETSVELMRLNADQRKERRLRRIAEQVEVSGIGLNVFVDRMRLDRYAFDRRRRHAPDVRNRAVRHEAAAK